MMVLMFTTVHALAVLLVAAVIAYQIYAFIVSISAYVGGIF
jgi:hypothetical protein